MMHLTAKDIQMAKDTHVTAPTRFVEAGGTRHAYRGFGAETGTPLVFLQHFRGGLDNWDPLVTDGTSVPDCAACRDDDLHRSGRRGGKAVSRLAFEYQRLTAFSLWAPTEPTCLRFAATHSRNEFYSEPNW